VISDLWSPPPGGDLARTVDPAMYAQLNAVKRLVELNLKPEWGRRSLHELVSDADAVMVADRPGVAASWAATKPGAFTNVEPAYGTVTTRDGRRFAIAVLEDQVWQRLCRARGWTEWLGDERLRSPEDRRANQAELHARLDAAIAAIDSDQLIELIETYDLPLTAFLPPVSATNEQLALRGFGSGSRSHVPPVAQWPALDKSQDDTGGTE
jgi:crotonobetainyl-CoA:carnitine CoA-transferase CaiB-like acyl-CoA transferase